MLTSRLGALIRATIIGLATGLAAFPTSADDTDIYLVGSAGGEDTIRPNVLLVLDTSDSMNQDVTGTGLTRLENMRIALEGLVSTLDNVNVGMMRFNGHRSPNNPDPYVATGGPVVFPIANLDDALINVPGEIDVTEYSLDVQVSASSDDAEELGDTTVTLTDQILELGNRVVAEVGPLYIVAQDDDGWQFTGGKPYFGLASDPAQIHRNIMPFDFAESSLVIFRGVDVPKTVDLIDEQGNTVTSDVVINNATLSFVADFDQNDFSSVRISGVVDPDPATLPPIQNATNDITDRATTVAFQDWDIPEWDPGEAYTPNTTTPDLANVVQELVDDPAWTEGESMAFRVDDNQLGVSTFSNSRYPRTWDYEVLSGLETAGDFAPRLNIGYRARRESEQVALRFDNVRVPEGASITSATIDFFASDTANNDANPTYSIQIEGVTDSATMTAVDGDISTRGWNATSVPWSPTTAGLVEDDVVTTSDVSALVQAAVDDPAWCGGNALTVRIIGTGRLGVKSFDVNPTKGAVLRLNYDISTIPSGRGCIETDYFYQMSRNKDDGYERPDTTVNRGSDNLPLGNSGNGNQTRLVALTFQAVTLNPDTDVLEATLEVTAKQAEAGAVTVAIQGDTTGDSPDLLTASGDYSDATTRPRTTASVSWTPEDQTAEGQVLVSPDISSVIEEATASGTGWVANNALGIYVSRTAGTARRNVWSYNGSPFDSPRLRIKVKEFAGDFLFKTVRERLIEIIREQIHTLNRTPTAETLYEAALYWKGLGVEYGKQRGVQNDGMRFARVSHPGSYSGGTLSQPGSCSNDDLNTLDCKDEEITGSPVYISPFGTQECQENYMIFLSDGAPTQNGAVDQIKTLTGVASCSTNPKGANGNCTNDLLEYLQTDDQDTVIDGEQNVTTYTIGFNLDQGAGNQATVDFMIDLADKGGGSFYTADTAEQLTNVLTAIFTEILSRSSSFASPSLSVNAFNRLFSRDEVYFALFRPDTVQRWNGNVKKLNLCTSEADGCTLGELLDANGDAAIGADSRIEDSAQTVWTPAGVEDGPEIERGGAGEEIPRSDDGGTGLFVRTLYTDAGIAAQPASQVNLDTVSPSQKMTLSNHDTATAFHDAACAVPGDADCDDLMLWMLGQHGRNDDDATRPPPDEDHRWAFHDPLHSSPVIVTYGGDGVSTFIDKLFVGTNDGALHMLNADNGEEEWAFYPAEMLAIQDSLSLNSDSGDHAYGMDLTPRVRFFDDDGDGVVEPADGDLVHVFAGMRRGGQTLFAINATPIGGPLTNTTSGNVVPRYMWRIEGGTAGFERMTNTWSRPAIAKVSIDDGSGGTTSTTALIYGGGYDAALDDDYGLDATSGSQNLGNAVYIVDATTGNLIRSFSGSNTGHAKNITVDDTGSRVMAYSIASEVSTLDSDGNGLVDRLYVGDAGGNMWRIDLGLNLGAANINNDQSIVGKLAGIGVETDPDTPADERVILERPDILQVHDTEFTNGAARYDLVVTVTGNRPDPLNVTVTNRVYAFRDVNVGGMTDTDSDHLADDYPIVGGALDETVLSDITDNSIQDATGSTQSDALSDLQNKNGWYLTLETAGEKGLAAPITLAGKLFFTTFLPAGTADPCAASEGSGLLYAVDVLNGTAVINFEDDGETEVLDKADRTQTLGAGIPSSAVPIFQEEGVTLLVGSSGGAATVDPEISLPRERTFWRLQ